MPLNGLPRRKSRLICTAILIKDQYPIAIGGFGDHFFRLLMVELLFVPLHRPTTPLQALLMGTKDGLGRSRDSSPFR